MGCSAGDAGPAEQAITCAYAYTPECESGRDSVCIVSDSKVQGPSAYAAWLASTAHAEAASVKSFLELARELQDHGAPASLAHRARNAAREDVEHARVMARMARSHGAQVRRVRSQPMPARSLEAMARENAVEGCVRETWSALQACHQAQNAEDPQLRTAMRKIAIEESGHAQLAIDIARWADGRLNTAARQRIAAAKRKAIAELRSAIPDKYAELERRTGLPSRARTRTMLDGLERTLWVAEGNAVAAGYHA